MARKRRSAKGSGSSGSGAALLAIVALGAAGWWTASGGKRPDFSWASSQFSMPRFSSPKETEKNSARRQEVVAPARRQESMAKASPAPKADTPRPQLPVRPVTPSPRSQASQIMVLRPPVPVKTPQAPLKATIANIPVGRPMPGTTPTIIYASERTVIHENAWEKASAIGTVERGREMRSYGKTGKWHRVVVPSTSMIGWVHEDRLAASRPSPFFTGSIFRSQP
ncbi:hypothetical protein C7477_11571 [Phyllobacterium leguminum]|uniref:SH3 domain-containing protein n=2 Tax=Phyllobacterium leguminum TaxID=314237 RepID=A0A318T311_9HYPH|nr:hypothetical protein C7477_11571 [Phyllobacterium leguminum]